MVCVIYCTGELNSCVLDPRDLYTERFIIGVFLHFQFGGLIWELYGIPGNHCKVSDNQITKLIFIEEYVAKIINLQPLGISCTFNLSS